MHARPPGGPRPRPVADAAIAGLADRAEELAHRWLIALLESGPLDAATSVPVERLVADGPRLCAAVVRAVASDDALDALLGGEADRPSAAVGASPADLARLAGPGDTAAIVRGAEALRRAIWVAATAALPRDAAAPLSDAADRLAHVCAHLAAAAAPAVAHGDAASASAPARSFDHAGEGSPLSALAAEAASPGRPLDERLEEPRVERLRIAGERHGERPAPLWMAALERQIAEGGRSGGRFALLRVELDDADRLALAEGPRRAGEVFDRAGRAVRECIRRADLLAHEENGRLWVIAPEAGRPRAAALAARVADAVERAASFHGAPLTASIGVAVYPDDARDAAGLADQAEEGALAARAAGVAVAGAADRDEP
jgi:GGDEF domain-containing protein